MTTSTTEAMFKPVFQSNDGKIFDTKAELVDYYRLPKVKAAFMVLAENDVELTTWLMANEDIIKSAFDTGTIRRITKADSKKIDKALDVIDDLYATGNHKELAFLSEKRADLELKYKTQPRLKDEQKAKQAKDTLEVAAGETEGLADWCIDNRDAVLAAFEAGKIKRPVSPVASNALTEFRLKKAADKAAKVLVDPEASEEDKAEALEVQTESLAGAEEARVAKEAAAVIVAEKKAAALAAKAAN